MTSTAQSILKGTASRITLDPTVINPKELQFSDKLSRTIIGQPHGRAAAVRAYRRVLSYIHDAQTNSGSLFNVLALGGTTCGKTETFYRMVEQTHGRRDACIVINGPDFKHDYQMSGLIGASKNLAGWINKDAPDYIPPAKDEEDPYAQLSSHNLEYSKRGSDIDVVYILVDEVEKGCIELLHLLLRIMREGKLTLSDGEKVSFKRVVLWVAGNVGSFDLEKARDSAKNPLGFGAGHVLTDSEAEGVITTELKKWAPPEFRARVEENGVIVVFHDLTEEQIAQICELKVRELCDAVEKATGITLDVDAAVRDWLLEKSGTVAKMNGAVKTHITDVIDNELLKGTLKAGNTVCVSVVPVEVDGEPTLVDGKPVKKLEYGMYPFTIASGMDDELYQRLTAEFDANHGGAQRSKLRDARVDEAGVRARMAGNDTPKVAPAKKTRLLQPFQITVQTPDLESLGKLKAGLLRELASNLECRLANESSTFSEPFVAQIVVFSTLETMAAIHAAMPFAHVEIVGGTL